MFEQFKFGVLIMFMFFLYLIIVLDLLLIDVGAMKLMINW